MTEPKIYIADLAAYNNGILHGIWIDATKDLDAIQDKINDMLKSSPIAGAEEHAIHDFEDFEGYEVSTYDSLAELHKVALFIEEHGKLGAELLDYYFDFETAKKAMVERYYGIFESVEDYARQFTEETSEIPQHLAPYIDYERMGKDWEMSGDIISFELSHNEVHIFSGC